MNSLHRSNVRVAPWIGSITPEPEQTAFIEDALDYARS